MSSSQDFAEKVYAKLTAVLEDLTTLNVATYTIDEQGKATLRAQTDISLDGDITNQIPVGPEGKLDEALLKQHQSAIEQARGERKATIDTVMKIVQGRLEIEKAEATQ